MPRLITSMPASRFSAILRSSWAKAYGGIFSRRLLGFMQLLFELVADRAREHRARPACQIDAEVRPHLDQQLTAVQADLHTVRPLLRGQVVEVRDRRTRCTGAGR